MATPATSCDASEKSTSSSQVHSPEIRVTDDHGNGVDVQLPESATVNKALSFDVPEEHCQPRIQAALRPAPQRAASSEAALEPLFNHTKLPPTSNPIQDLDISTPQKRKPELTRTASGHGSLRTSLKNISSSNLFHSKKIDSGKSSVMTSATASPSETPEIRTIFSKKTCPDLDAVNKALESLRTQARSKEDPLVLNLSHLADEMRGAQADCSKLLTQAMKARDQKQHEICRSYCIRIIHNQHSKMETKVYAYNILSTQASPGQAMHFLNEAAKLAKQCSDTDRDKLTSIVAMLIEHQELQEGRLSGERNRRAAAQVNQRIDLGTFERPPTIPRSLRVPEVEGQGGRSGAMTPKTEKILGWAAPGMK